MIDIVEYIKLPRDKRIEHINLSEECVVIDNYRNTRKLQAILSNYLHTTIPIVNSQPRILVCHLCYNPNCCNPLHLYWGSDVENSVIDASLNTEYMNVWERRVQKHGFEKACAMNVRSSEQARQGGLANKGLPKSKEHRQKISDAIKKKHEEKKLKNKE